MEKFRILSSSVMRRDMRWNPFPVNGNKALAPGSHAGAAIRTRPAGIPRSLPVAVDRLTIATTSCDRRPAMLTLKKRPKLSMKKPRKSGTGDRENNSCALRNEAVPMKKYLIAATLAAVTLPLAPATAVAGPIESACLSSGRQAASRALCRCVQQAADATLTRGDQRQAAAFFRDPHKSQEIRASKSASDSAFWARYRQFGATAEAHCTGS
ncbi:hypothetical protein ACFQXB_07205 [Plastorhodobacter daqingensis]|uniref:Arginine transporter n=1 Tax=Plastorhodobacter daqingensis TaxID=1387281 RepID=A0ABW2UH19_9RHOB